MAKRRAILAEDTEVTKTTLAESPEATRKLTDIKVEEVSVVDFPANGEPFMIMKSLNKEKVEKVSREQVPLEKMKDLHKKLTDIQKTLNLVNNEIDNSKVEKSVDEDPVILKGLFNSVISTLKSIRGDKDASPVDFETVSKQYENVEKGNAISFLTRDRYAYVTQSVSEYVTTYVDGMEHDDEGPMLIPLGLDSGVEDSLEKMEDVVESSESEEDKETHKNIETIDSLKEEIATLKKQLENATVIEENIDKKGSKISKDRLKKLKSIATDIGNAHDQMSKFLNDLEIGSEDREERSKMSEEKIETVAEEVAEKSENKTEEPKVEETEKAETKEVNQFDQLAKSLEALCEKLDARFEKLEETQKANSEELKKFANLRVDSRVDADNNEKAVEKSADDIKKEKASFKNILFPFVK